LKTIYKSMWGVVFPTCGDFVWGYAETLLSAPKPRQRNTEGFVE
jgi:hypothetical protein